MPQNKEEYFNMKHASARNVIERCFGLLKMRWGILRLPSFYNIQTQCRIITTCCLLHNLIRMEMSIDLLEHEVTDINDFEDEDVETLGTLDSSDEWNMWRNNLTMDMFDEWRGNKSH